MNRTRNYGGMRCLLYEILLLAWIAAGAEHGSAAPVPAVPDSDYLVLEEWAYESDAAAEKAWEPMDGSARAASVLAGRRRVVKLPCNFAGTDIERASWDFALQADLAACQGFAFQVFCPDPAPVSHFSFYLASGNDGWYSGSFTPAARGWQTVVVWKSDMEVEGRPAGWGRITRIRISAWRGLDRDTALYVADFAGVGGPAPIALVRDETPGGDDDSMATAIRYTRPVARFLGEAVIPHIVLSDLDLTPRRLRSLKLLVLPHNPRMPPDVAGNVRTWIERGGRLLAFHAIPPALRTVAGISPGRYMRGPYGSIRFKPRALPAAPPTVAQKSWGACPPAGRPGVRVLAEWHDVKGKPTGRAAIAASAQCLFMSHVLLEDDPANKRRMLTAMVGHFLPDTWHSAAAAAIVRAGLLGPYGDFDGAVTDLQKRGRGNPDVAAALRAAAADRRAADRLASQKKYPESLDAAERARSSLLRAYCLVQQPLDGEFRGFWCHRPFGVSDKTWDQSAALLAASGVTDIVPNMCWGGIAYYDSEILPVAPGARAKGDRIVECLDACRKHGLRMHVWKVNWNLGWPTDKAHIRERRKEGRLIVGPDGETMNWLCPSHPENQRLETEAMLEIVRKYPVHGIHFDYMRYPGKNACFCAGCRSRFEAAIGEKVDSWPARVREKGPLHDRWLAWRQGHITKVVRDVAERARKIRPAIRISAAVFGNWPVDRNNVAQDWKLWCQRGYLDFVCPMNYTSNPDKFRALTEQQVRWASGKPCYPGIGFSASRPSMDVEGLVQQIILSRELRTGGFMVFEYDRRSSRMLPLLGLGLTRPARRNR